MINAEELKLTDYSEKGQKAKTLTYKKGLLKHLVLMPLLAQLLELLVAAVLAFFNLVSMGMLFSAANQTTAKLSFIITCLIITVVIAVICARNGSKKVRYFSPADVKRTRWICFYPVAFYAVMSLLESIFQNGLFVQLSYYLNPVIIAGGILLRLLLGSMAITLLTAYYVVYAAVFHLLTRKALNAALIKAETIVAAKVKDAETGDVNVNETAKVRDGGVAEVNVEETAKVRDGGAAEGKSSDAVKPDGKLKRNIFKIAAALVTVIAIVFSSLASFADLEYAYLNHKFNQLNINDTEDYDFSLSLPFCTPSRVAVLEQAPQLTFDVLEETPRMDGATAFFPVYSAFAQHTYSALNEYVNQDIEEYEERHRWEYWGISIGYEKDRFHKELIACTKTSSAYKRLADGETDIIFAFEPSTEQAEYFESKGVEYELTPIGYDALCFFVSENNAVSSLTLDEVRSIYTGKIRTWNKLGGKNRRILAFTRPEGSGSQTVMESLVMRGEEINSIYKAVTVRTMGGMLRVANSYLNTDNALGYTFMYYSSTMVTNDSVKYLSIDGALPTLSSVRSGAYPLRVPFYAVTRKNRGGQTQRLLDFILSSQGQELVELSGYVPVG